MHPGGRDAQDWAVSLRLQQGPGFVGTNQDSEREGSSCRTAWLVRNTYGKLGGRGERQPLVPLENFLLM